MRLSPLLLLSLSTGVFARHDHNDTQSASSSAVNGTSTVNGTSQTGGQQCTRLMCITGIVNGSNVDWTLSSTGQTPGWMSIGYGTQMAGSPMVIMWSNSDGSITLSQRQASGEVEPSVVSSPSKVATLLESASSTSGSGSNIKLAFTMPYDGSKSQKIIWAFSTRNPGSSAKNANLAQHLDAGALNFDLTSTVNSSNSSSSGNSFDSVDIPLSYYQKLIVAHAVFCVFGFLLLLPAGVLLARYLRTFSPRWYTGHWIAQFGIAGPIIIVGFALGVQSVTSAQVPHLNDDHKKWGVGIFFLYLVQCSLGAIIHFIKPKRFIGRPPQNYLHAIVGLLLIAAALKQVRNGYNEEWADATGRGGLPNSINVVWYMWVVLLPVLYAAGLAFLPKQYRQEAESRMNLSKDTHVMTQPYFNI